MEEEKTTQTILIIEDDSQILNVLADKLNQEGFNTLQSRDGEAGLIMAMDNHPDLILLDILLPKMDGLTVMKKLRAENSWGKNVPIILLTNLSSDSEKVNKSITEDTPAYYLIKTERSMEEVVDKVRERLSNP